MLQGFGHRCFDRLGPRQIQGQRQRPDSGGFEFLLHLFTVLHAPRAEHQVGARFRVSLGNLLAESSTTAGDQRDFTIQPKQFKHIHSFHLCLWWSPDVPPNGHDKDYRPIG
ncbi:hypothetical protein GCM10025857_11170 [Alicyclobacillus contaminans]|nr:hypothetical protein GCM10025857_11170 [Alicyclobacillus contaminans]